MPKISKEKIDEAIKLRLDQKLSGLDISKITGISTTSLSRILRYYPLKDQDYKKMWSDKVKGKFKKFKGIEGQRFGNLTVIERIYKKSKESIWLCLCDCGDTCEVVRTSLVQEDTRSCGCLRSLEGKTGVKGSSCKNIVLNRYKGLKDKWFLSDEKAIQLFESCCFYCGCKPSSEQKPNKESSWLTSYFYNGIDRIDNSLGYVENNVVSCCKSCNYAKRDRTLENFKIWVINLYKNLILKGGYDDGKDLCERDCESETNSSNSTNPKSGEGNGAE